MNNLSVEDEIKDRGFQNVRNRYWQEREFALERGDEDEASEWKGKWEEAGRVFGNLRRKYWIGVGALSFVLTLFIYYAFGIYEEFGVLTFALWYFFALFTLGHFALLAFYCAGGSMLGAIGVLLWHSYLWLKSGVWPETLVVDGLAFFEISFTAVSVEAWVGVSNIINGAVFWFLERSLSDGLLYLAALFYVIGIVTERWRPPGKDPWDIG